jgi:hypothetical protein
MEQRAVSSGWSTHGRQEKGMNNSNRKIKKARDNLRGADTNGMIILKWMWSAVMGFGTGSGVDWRHSGNEA